MFYVECQTEPMDVTPSTSKGSQGQPLVNNSMRPLSTSAEEEVDQQLWKLDGKIQRKRDEKL